MSDRVLALAVLHLLFLWVHPCSGSRIGVGGLQAPVLDVNTADDDNGIDAFEEDAADVNAAEAAEAPVLDVNTADDDNSIDAEAAEAPVLDVNTADDDNVRDAEAAEASEKAECGILKQRFLTLTTNDNDTVNLTNADGLATTKCQDKQIRWQIIKTLREADGEKRSCDWVVNKTTQSQTEEVSDKLRLIADAGAYKSVCFRQANELMEECERMGLQPAAMNIAADAAVRMVTECSKDTKKDKKKKAPKESKVLQPDVKPSSDVDESAVAEDDSVSEEQAHTSE